MKTKIKLADQAHEVAYQDLAALMSKHAATVTGLELLAIAANMLGKLVALQDQRTVSSGVAMEVVAVNLEYGNQSVIAQLMGKSDGSA